MAMREFGRDRVRRGGIREERLRATAGLRGVMNLTSWRGRSGRRYVVGVHPLSEAELREVSEAVLIAVHRDRDGTARLVDVAAIGCGLSGSARRAWLARTRRQGATEIHLHRLAESGEERQSIAEDLREPAP
jgi:hypothetical protein